MMVAPFGRTASSGRSIREVVEGYLDCGNPGSGFARIRCQVSRTEHFPALLREMGGLSRQLRLGQHQAVNAEARMPLLLCESRNRQKTTMIEQQ